MLFCTGLKYSLLFWEQVAEEHIQMKQEGSNKTLEKAAKWGRSFLSWMCSDSGTMQCTVFVWFHCLHLQSCSVTSKKQAVTRLYLVWNAGNCSASAAMFVVQQTGVGGRSWWHWSWGDWGTAATQQTARMHCSRNWGSYISIYTTHKTFISGNSVTCVTFQFGNT